MERPSGSRGLVGDFELGIILPGGSKMYSPRPVSALTSIQESRRVRELFPTSQGTSSSVVDAKKLPNHSHDSMLIWICSSG